MLCYEKYCNAYLDSRIYFKLLIFFFTQIVLYKLMNEECGENQFLVNLELS